MQWRGFWEGIGRGLSEDVGIVKRLYSIIRNSWISSWLAKFRLNRGGLWFEAGRRCINCFTGKCLCSAEKKKSYAGEFGGFNMVWNGIPSSLLSKL